MQNVEYGIAEKKWELKSGFGNHRFIVRSEKTDYARAVIPWRRRDDFFEKCGVRIRYNACPAEGPVASSEIKDLKITAESAEYAEIFFRAPVEGLYEIYYMPFEMRGEWWEANVIYMDSALISPSREWLSGLDRSAVSDCTVLRYESRTEHDSFFPMDFPMTKEERNKFFDSCKPFVTVTESRLHPVRMKHDPPFIWNNRTNNRLTLNDTVAKNEHYTFQLAVCALKKLKNIHVRFFDGSGVELETDKCFCINTYGVDADGNEISIARDVDENEILPLWCCVDVVKFTGKELRLFAEVSAENVEFSETAEIELSVTDEILPNNGDDDLWRHSRLFWLNSKIGISDNVISPYEPVRADENSSSISLLGKEIIVGKLGLPEQIASYFDSGVRIRKDRPPVKLLKRPVLFSAKRNGENVAFVPCSKTFEKHGSMNCDVVTSAAGELLIDSKVSYEADGFIDTKITVRAEVEGDYEFQLSFSLDASVAKYMMGMCREGGTVPESWEYGWNESFDGNIVWLGSTRGGLQIKLMPEDERWGGVNPLPASWSSGGGKMRVERSEDSGEVRFYAYSGIKKLRYKDKLVFHFHMIVTPLHEVDYVSHFSKHYYHSNSWHSDEPIVSLERAIGYGADTVILHQGGPLNENINYPFHLSAALRKEVEHAHSLGLKYKLYYTVRELSNFADEIWAFRSLGDEILYTGDNFKIADYFVRDDKSKERTTGGPWLIEHFGDGYCPAWHQPLVNGEYDCAVKIQSKSRFHNYYLKGLDWLIRCVGIDGLYLDGIGYDRHITRRLRRVMNDAKEGCDVDIHIGNEHTKYYSYASPACEYLEHFAYADKLWIGEGYDYRSEGPDYFLTEVSGLPFGLTSEMLEGGGNPWRGMIFGMTTRAGWSQGGLTLPIWRLWDEFGIKEAKMVGYWNPGCPVSTENDLIKATAFIKKDGSVLISIASWYPTDREFLVSVDREALELKGEFELYAPFIESFQEEAVFDPNGLIPIPAGKGWIFIIRKKD